MQSLQTLTAVQSSVDSLFNTERHLTSRDTCKPSRAAALAEWLALRAD